MFVSLEKIVVGQHPVGSQHGHHQNQGQCIPTSTATTTTTGDSYAAKVLSKPHSSNAGPHPAKSALKVSNVDPQTSSSSKPQSRYKVNERVIVFDKNNIALHGVIKWTGRESRLGSEGMIHVGIEMVYVHILHVQL